MKFCGLFIFSLLLVISVNGNAEERKCVVKGKEQSGTLQQLNQQAADASKVAATNQNAGEMVHQHDVLKTQFLGKRPYMETKTK